MSKQEGMDFAKLADNVDEMREGMRVMVAGFVADGFTDEQARDIIAGLWRSIGTKVSGNDEEGSA